MRWCRTQSLRGGGWGESCIFWAWVGKDGSEEAKRGAGRVSHEYEPELAVVDIVKNEIFTVLTLIARDITQVF